MWLLTEASFCWLKQYYSFWQLSKNQLSQLVLEFIDLFYVYIWDSREQIYCNVNSFIFVTFFLLCSSMIIKHVLYQDCAILSLVFLKKLCKYVNFIFLFLLQICCRHFKKLRIPHNFTQDLDRRLFLAFIIQICFGNISQMQRVSPPTLNKTVSVAFIVSLSTL